MDSRAEPSVFHYCGLVIFSLVVVLISDLSLTWIVLLTIVLIFAVSSFWFKDIQSTLFFGLVSASSMNISKALIVDTGKIYTPGLYMALSDVFFIPLLILWFIDRKILRKRKIYWSSLHTMPLLFLIWMWITIFISEDPFAGILVSITYTKYFLMFIVIADYISDSRHLRIALYAFGMGTLAHIIVGLLEYFSGGAFAIQGGKLAQTGARLVFQDAGGVHAFRPSGLGGHPNILADILVFVLPMSLLLILLGKKFILEHKIMGRLAYVGMYPFFVSGVVVLVLTLSRGGWLSFVFGSLYMIYFGYKKGVVPKSIIRGLVVSAMIGMVAVVVIFPTALLRITESDERSGETRVVMAHQAALIIERNPIMGVGIAGYNRAARANIPEIFSLLGEGYRKSILKGIVHNKYLLVMAETGIVGIVLFLLTLWRFLTVVPKGDYWTDPVLYSLGLGLSAGIAGQIAFFMLDHFYVFPRIAFLYVFFGCLSAVIKLQKQENQSLPGTSLQ